MLKNNNTKIMVTVALFVALIAIGAFMSIPVGPVSITLQTLFVMLSGFFLGKKAYLASTVYVLMGVIGIPIFSGFRGGLSSIYMPSFGFLIGMIFSALYISIMFEKVKNINFLKSLIIFITASVIIYLFGIPYMSYILNVYFGKGLSFSKILSIGMIVFIPGDILKCIVAANIVSRKQMKKYRIE
ncbi:biotin transporter BioY [Helcococcus ovis]|uniref:biotin transporter BioY n=1 Tax=Helcococcus ovis TaxID=72026 RepID=UPI0038BD8AD5